MYSAIVLAAGLSTRMTENKLLKAFGDTTIIEHVVSVLTHSNFDDIVLVVGRDKEKLFSCLKPYPVTIVYNPAYAIGQSSSVKIGLSQLKPSCKGVFFIMGDQPFVTAKDLNQMISCHKQALGKIIVPIDCKTLKRGSPVLFDHAYIETLNHISGDKGGRGIIADNPHAVYEYRVTTPHFFLDVDTQEAYQKVLSILEADHA